ncbi:MAG: beta-ketoacyl-ACP synthase II [Anaerolineae bacterium]
MSDRDSQRIAIVGLGAVTPLGLDLATTWQAVLAGHSGVGPITQFDASNLKTQIAAEVKGFDPGQYMDRREVRRSDRFVHLAIAAAAQAIADSGLDLPREDPRRIGAIVGSAIGGVNTLLEQTEVLRQRGPSRVGPFAISSLMLNAASAQIALSFGLRGPNLGIATACATGAHSLGEAAEVIRRGRADVMIAGASESSIVPVAFAAFDNMQALASRNDAPDKACRPFDSDRAGFVIGEGAAITVLERMDRAKARGVHIYGELAGYGNTDDAFHMAAPHDQGTGAIEAMLAALESAGLPPSAVNYINPHGTGTRIGDPIETRAVRAVFGAHADSLAMSSTKSMTGHMLGVAGTIEAIFCLLAIRDQMLPPTINLDTPDPECDLDYVPNVARPATIEVAMSNSFGLGGHDASLILSRVD